MNKISTSAVHVLITLASISNQFLLLKLEIKESHHENIPFGVLQHYPMQWVISNCHKKAYFYRNKMSCFCPFKPQMTENSLKCNRTPLIIFF